MEDPPENTENVQETEQNVFQETPAIEQSSFQEIHEEAPVLEQNSLQETIKKPGRPRKTEEEKKETRRQKYLRAKERRESRESHKVVTITSDSTSSLPSDIPDWSPPPDPVPQLSPMDVLRQMLNSASTEQKRKKTELYDSWFAHLRS
jgi:hypothetical protein